MSFYSVIAFLSALVASALGVVVLLHESRSKAHFAFVGGMLVLAVDSVFVGMAADSGLTQTFKWQNWSQFCTALLPGLWLLFSFIYARGNALEFIARWKWGIALAFILPIALVMILRGQLVVPDSGSSDPTAVGIVMRLTTGAIALQVLFLLTSILILMNLERTFRSAVGTMRWRIKFMVLGLGVLFSVRAYTASQFLLFRALDPAMQALNSSVLLLGGLLIMRSLLRAGHFQVSVYPSQSVITNSLTVMVAGIYLVLVGLLAKAVTMFGGAAGFTVKTFLVLVAMVILTIILLSDRVRVSTRRFISRHFQRPLYDYRSVWKTFTEGTASRVEQSDLCDAVVRMVSDIFQALSVTMWLVDERKEHLVFAASSTLSEVKAGQMKLEREEAAAVIRALAENSGPVDIDSSKEPWAAALRRTHPDEFRHGGNRVCVPLVAGGELLGIMTLGDRVGGLAFSVQDLDLLKSVSDQSAANLLNIELSQRLSRAKQLEAFQAMSAFFVHDLKNTASTLSLMLQNLPVHYQDPKFREDALRGISKTVDNINDLIQRLSVLRHELRVHPVECDLNELLRSFLSCEVQAQGVEVQAEFHPLPKLKVDPDQIRKVVTNLLINAREAVSAGGRIRVETNRQKDWAVLAISDNGCGMSPDFVQKSLFRPFQTTKKRGIGIGMFHCKMIVEAHRGRIEVESEQGKGTSFRVLLPITA